MNLPLNVVAGLSAGYLRELAKDREAIWASVRSSISASIVGSGAPSARVFIDWQTSFFFMILGLEFCGWRRKAFFPQWHLCARIHPRWLVTRRALYGNHGHVRGHCVEGAQQHAH